MFRSRRKHAALEASLRANRAEPRPEFVAAIVDASGRAAPQRRAGSFQVAFAGGLPPHCSWLSRRSAASAMQLQARRAQSARCVKRVTSAGKPRTVRGSAAKPVEGRITICHHVPEQPDGDDHHQRQRFAGAPAAWGHDRAVPGRRCCGQSSRRVAAAVPAVSWASPRRCRSPASRSPSRSSQHSR